MFRFSIASFILVLLVPAAALAVVIDDFSVGPIVLSTETSSINEWQRDLDPAAVIGGKRNIVVAGLARSNPPTVATVDTAAGTFSLDINHWVEGYWIAWGSLDTFDPFGDLALNADLLADGSDAFRIDVAASATSQTLTFSAKSGVDEGRLRGNGVFLDLLASDSPRSIRVPFSDFPRVDFRDVDAVVLGRSPVFVGADLTLSGIRTVPEPQAMVLLVLGLWAIVVLRGSGHRLVA